MKAFASVQKLLNQRGILINETKENLTSCNSSRLYSWELILCVDSKLSTFDNSVLHVAELVANVKQMHLCTDSIPIVEWLPYGWVPH